MIADRFPLGAKRLDQLSSSRFQASEYRVCKLQVIKTYEEMRYGPVRCRTLHQIKLSRPHNAVPRYSRGKRPRCALNRRLGGF